MIKINSGNNPVINQYKKKASQVFAYNDVVTTDASGFLIPATATTALAKIIGLVQKDVVATDDDYADTTFIPVMEVGSVSEAQFVADVGTGTAVQAMVGLVYDLKNATELDVSAVAIKVFKVQKIISTSKVLGRFVNA